MIYLKPLRWIIKNPVLSVLSVSLLANLWFWIGRERAEAKLESQRVEWANQVNQAKTAAQALQEAFDAEKAKIIAGMDMQHEEALRAINERVREVQADARKLRSQLDEFKSKEAIEWFTEVVPVDYVSLVSERLRVPAGGPGDSDED